MTKLTINHQTIGEGNIETLTFESKYQSRMDAMGQCTKYPKWVVGATSLPEPSKLPKLMEHVLKSQA